MPPYARQSANQAPAVQRKDGHSTAESQSRNTHLNHKTDENAGAIPAAGGDYAGDQPLERAASTDLKRSLFDSPIGEKRPMAAGLIRARRGRERQWQSEQAQRIAV